MSEKEFHAVTKEELKIALKVALVEQKDEFVREVRVAMDEFTSQMKIVSEFALGMHEDHEKRISALEKHVF